MDQFVLRPIEYKIIRELHEGEKNVAELSDILTQKTKDLIIEKLYQGKKDVVDISKLLLESRRLTSVGLTVLIDNGLVYKKDVILKKPENNKSGRKGQIYFLTKTGQEFYQAVYG